MLSTDKPLVDPSDHDHRFWAPDDETWDEPARTLDELVERVVDATPDLAPADIIIARPLRRAREGGQYLMESYNTGDRYTLCCGDTLQIALTPSDF